MYLNRRLIPEDEAKTRRRAEDCISRPCLPFCQTVGLESLVEAEGSADGGTEEEIEAEHGEKGKPARWCLEQSGPDAIETGSDEVVHQSWSTTGLKPVDHLKRIASTGSPLRTDGIDLNSGIRRGHTAEPLEHSSLALEPQALSPVQTVSGVFRDVTTTSRHSCDKVSPKLDNDTGTGLMPAIFEMLEMKWCLNASFSNDKQPFVVARIGNQETGRRI